MALSDSELRQIRDRVKTLWGDGTGTITKDEQRSRALRETEVDSVIERLEELVRQAVSQIDLGDITPGEVTQDDLNSVAALVDDALIAAAAAAAAAVAADNNASDVALNLQTEADRLEGKIDGDIAALYNNLSAEIDGDIEVAQQAIETAQGQAIAAALAAYDPLAGGDFSAFLTTATAEQTFVSVSTLEDAQSSIRQTIQAETTGIVGTQLGAYDPNPLIDFSSVYTKSEADSVFYARADIDASFASLQDSISAISGTPTAWVDRNFPSDLLSLDAFFSASLQGPPGRPNNWSTAQSQPSDKEYVRWDLGDASGGLNLAPQGALPFIPGTTWQLTVTFRHLYGTAASNQYTMYFLPMDDDFDALFGNVLQYQSVGSGIGSDWVTVSHSVTFPDHDEWPNVRYVRPVFLANSSQLPAAGEQTRILSFHIEELSGAEAAFAAADQKFYARADVDQALATLSSNLTAQFDTALGPVEASVDVVAQALATVEGNQEALIGFEVTGGGAQAALQLIAADSPGQPYVSTARISAENILLKGSVSTEMLTVGTGQNLMPDPHFEAFTEHLTSFKWGTGDFAEVSYNLVLRGQPWAHPVHNSIELRQTGTGDVNLTVVGQAVDVFAGTVNAPVAPISEGEWIEFSAYVSTYRCNATVQIAFFDGNNTRIATSTGNLISNQSGPSDNPRGWARAWVKGKAPANAVSVRPYFTKYGNPTGSNSRARFFEPMLAFSHEEASQPKPFSHQGTTLIQGGMIAANAIFAKHVSASTIRAEHIAAEAIEAHHIKTDTLLVTDTANIDTAVINTLHLKGQSITVHKSQTLTSSSGGDGDYKSVQWFNINVPSNGQLTVFFSARTMQAPIPGSASSPPDVDIRLQVNYSTVLEDFYSDERRPIMIWAGPVTANSACRVEVFARINTAAALHRRTLVAFLAMR